MTVTEFIQYISTTCVLEGLNPDEAEIKVAMNNCDYVMNPESCITISTYLDNLLLAVH